MLMGSLITVGYCYSLWCHQGWQRSNTRCVFSFPFLFLSGQGFLAVGFQLSTIHSPSISVHEFLAEDNFCYQFNSCGDCINQKDCGFCYVQDDSTEHGAANGSCLEISPRSLTTFAQQCRAVERKKRSFWTFLSSDDFSAQGRCSEAAPDLGVTFAPDYCPSDLAWIVVLGLCSYLVSEDSTLGPVPLLPFSLSCSFSLLLEWAQCLGLSTQRFIRSGLEVWAILWRPRSTGHPTSSCRWPSSALPRPSPSRLSLWSLFFSIWT